MFSHDEFVIAMLVEDGRLDRARAEDVARHALEKKVGKSQAVIDLGIVPARDVTITRAAIAECPFVDLDQFETDISNASRLPRTVAEGLEAFPLFELGDLTTVGMADPLDLKAVDQLRALLKTDIEPVLCEPGALAKLIASAYSLHAGGDTRLSPAVQAASLTTGDEPIVAAVNQIIAQAVMENASDIHIGPDESSLHLRFRVDGALHPRQGPPLSAHLGLVQRLKVMANLDLTVTRRPQDGKFRFTHADRAVDIRLSIIPTVCGENVVMRLLASGGTIKGFAELGLPPAITTQFESAIEHPHGMILVTGPTGSGKTTTLYTAIKRLNSPDVNVMTIEDPVEIRLPMVRQIQVHSEIGMTFAGALRSILRQDPDVVLVGEIRDEETARIAVQAALTGHLVLSTLHTNDAPGAIARLRDFGLPAFAINSALLCVVAQRLVRRVCQHCAAPDHPTPLVLARFGLSPDKASFQRGAGCGRCSSTGYRGRIGVYEMLDMGIPVQKAIDKGATTIQIKQAAESCGYRPMWFDGLEKAQLGHTTLEEVSRVVALELSGEDAGSADHAAHHPDGTAGRLSA
ncbi:MAG: type II/IV secretion system protein [Phycisphaeraceae bacterium]|nr:type II/IV secretion system protein [Phycisphaeraceae bacterium]